ncbi:MAG: hypothetical protein WAW17_20095 [Rhodococcus sp. (in: high G+C Gram-positive bacteria)]|uniref:hypothetical protein n=1 Tax=Rhodococcus sp. TaxID=1831 RepID=UPI003BB05C38
MTDVPVECSSRPSAATVNTTEWIKAHLARMDHADPADTPAAGDARPRSRRHRDRS